MSNSPPTQPSAIVPGAILAGKYRVERIIGQGGMGLVVEARHIALDERVALKFLLPEYAQHPEASTRFLREARAAAKIKSEHVARVSDVGNLESGAPYMMMEFLEGADLAQTLERLGVLPVEDAIDYILQGCEAIAEAHQHGIVHRDLKPANLFLTKRPDGMPLVKVLDFGISKVSGGVDNLTRTTAAMGSALYMSPEQMQQTRGVDHRTDIYALGVALYELLAGKQPYYADTLPQLCAEVLTGTPTPIRAVRPEISDELAQALEKAYARDRGLRYQSIADLVIALAPWAPARSQQTIDRVARMASLPIPVAGTAYLRASSPSQPSLGRQSNPQLHGGTQRMDTGPQPQYPRASQPGMGPQPQYAPTPQPGMGPAPQYAPAPQPQYSRASQPGTPATEALPVMDPTAGGPPPPGMGPAVPRATPLPAVMQGVSQIVPDHYQAPASSRASAAFRQSAFPAPGDGSMAATGRSAPGGSKAGMVIAILGVLVIGGAALALLLRSHDGPTPAPSSPPVTERTADTGAVRPPDTGPVPTAAVTNAPVDVKSAPPALSGAEPPAKTAQPPGGTGAKGPLKGPVIAPTATHAPSPTAPPPTAPVAPPPPVDPLNPGKRQG